MKLFRLNKKQISDAELRRRKRGRQHGSVHSTPALCVKVDDQEGVLESEIPQELCVLFEVEPLSIDDASFPLLEWYERGLAGCAMARTEGRECLVPPEQALV